MDTIMALIMGSLTLLIITWICYSRLTSSIIKDQEREIARLKREKNRLESAVRGARMVKNIEVYTEPKKPYIRIERNTNSKDELFGEW